MEEIELAIPGCFLSVSDDNLLIGSSRPLSSLSTAIYGGGLRTIRYAINHRLTTHRKKTSPAAPYQPIWKSAPED